MCTGFIRRGNDIVFGYNLDLQEGAWDYKVYCRNNMFYVGINVNDAIYKTHGLNGNGSFGCMPYMNAPECGEYQEGRKFQRLDLLVNDYISGTIDYDELMASVRFRSVVNAPNCSMHSLFGDATGRMLLVEPGLGWHESTEKYSAVTNYPLLRKPEDLSSDLSEWFGIERRRQVCELLERSDENFSVEDGMETLRTVLVKGDVATRVSFAYSVNQRVVLYALEGDFNTVQRVELAPLNRV